jgi:4-carboxymuconolactone decarboxylase
VPAQIHLLIECRAIFICSKRRNSMDAQQPISTAADLLGDIAQKLLELTERVLFGDVWERPGLSKRDRSLITVTALISLNRTQQLPFHLERALANGLTRDELVEAITHLAFYSGWPTSVSAATIAKEVFSRSVRPVE